MRLSSHLRLGARVPAALTNQRRRRPRAERESPRDRYVTPPWSGPPARPVAASHVYRTVGGLARCAIDINRTPVSKTRPLSPYQLTHDKVMQAWTSDIHAAARQEPTGDSVFLLYSTQSSSYIYRYTVLIRDYYYIAIYT